MRADVITPRRWQASNFADNQRRSGLRLGKPAFQSTECRLPRRNAVKAGPQPMSFKTFQTSTRRARRPGRIGFGSARHQGVADTKVSSVSGQQPAGEHNKKKVLQQFATDENFAV